jgi:hypothetical protein
VAALLPMLVVASLASVVLGSLERASRGVKLSGST